MAQTRDWQGMRSMSGRLLKERSGDDVDTWNRRIQKLEFTDEKGLREWLTKQGVTGYAQSLLVMERFGCPDFFLASAGLGEVTIQARKTYISLVTPRRTFARVQPTTKNCVDLGLRLEGQKLGGRLQPSKMNETMKLQINLSALDEVDAEVLDWLQEAYNQNC